MSSAADIATVPAITAEKYQLYVAFIGAQKNYMSQAMVHRENSRNSQRRSLIWNYFMKELNTKALALVK